MSEWSELSSALLPVSPSPAAAPSAVTGPEVTGEKLLVFPKATLSSAMRSLTNITAIKKADIASVEDFSDQEESLSVAFQQSGAEGLRFEHLDALVVRDASLLEGLSLAAISGPMPVIGDIHYVVPAAQNQPQKSGEFASKDLKKLLEYLQRLTQLLESSGILEEVSMPQAQASVAPAAGAVKTWGIDAVKAVSSTLTGKGVRVAIIDTGIDPNHPDLASKIEGTMSFVPESINDLIGHGTHVAGTVAGPRTGAALNYGVAPEARLYIAKVFGQNDTGGTDKEIVAAINWAISKKCAIANMSLSSRFPLRPGTRFDPAFDQLAQNALQSGLLLVAASGNASQRPGVISPVGHPANCPHVVAVGALTQNRQLAVFSNAGQADPSNGPVDFAAPGDRIASAFPTNLPVPPPFSPVPGFPNGFAFSSGTSMASPHVAGLAALMAQKFGIGGRQLLQALAFGEVDKLGGLPVRDIGFGMPLAIQS